MWFENEFTKAVGIQYPIVLAPMAGGPSTPLLAAAVSNAGGLGSLACAYLPPEQIRRDIQATREKTHHPFAVNLFALAPSKAASSVDPQRIGPLLSKLNSYRQELGLAMIDSLPEKRRDSFDEEVAVILEERPSVFSFTFGIPSKDVLEECRRRNILTMGTATSLAEGEDLANAGVDIVCAQGSEAGGHRGTFLGPVEKSLIGTASLVATLSERLDLPVIAAGGIMNGRGIAASLMLGAQGVQMGTAFLLCKEAGTSAPYREELKSSARNDTRITRMFSGKEARGIENRFMREMEEFKSLAPEFPMMNALTAEIRREAAKQGKSEYLSLWAGQAADLIRETTASELVEALVKETNECFAKVADLGVSATGEEIS